MIVEGLVDGRQGEKLKMIVPQTDLNMVRNSPLARRIFSLGGRGRSKDAWWVNVMLQVVTGKTQYFLV